jgi:hypothetical protein
VLKVHGSALVHIGHMLGLMQGSGIVSANSPSSSGFPQNLSITIPDVQGNHTIHINKPTTQESKEDEKKSVQELMPEIITWFEDLEKRCNEWSLRLSAKQIARMIEDLKREPVPMASFGTASTALCERIEDELSEIKLLKLEGNAELYNTVFPFGKDVGEKLPSAAEDSQEAATCLSLERWTACVFHLMRVMEIGVQKFGEKIGVKLVGEKNWQNILDEVNKSIRSMDQKADQTKKYAALAAHLYNVKIAWRNEVMHPKATYTPQEADEIYKHVSTFIGYLVQVV